MKTGELGQQKIGVRLLLRGGESERGYTNCGGEVKVEKREEKKGKTPQREGIERR